MSSMPAPSPSKTGRPPHVVVLGLGAASALLGAATVALGSTLVGLPLVVFGGLFVALGVLSRASAGGVPLVNTAFNAMLEGRSADAERLLDEAEGRWQLAYVRRVIDLHRADIAMRRGQLDVALGHVEAALAKPRGLVARNQAGYHLIGAQATRALVRASTGDVDGARADAREVKAHKDAAPEALARASVAEAIALERSGDRDALAAHLRTERSLLLEYTTPRERAVVRAYQRMLEAPRTSVYRKTASRDEEARHVEPPIADWIAQVAPSAAPFASRVRVATADGSPEDEAALPPVEPGLVRLAEERVASKAKTQPVRTRARFVAIWLALILLFVAVFQLISPGEGSPPPMIGVDSLVALAGALLVLTLVAATLVAGRNVGQDKRLALAMSALARGDKKAMAEVEAMARSRYRVTAAQACLQLARMAERRSDLETALRRCDEGIEAATHNEATRSLLSSILLPDLVAERAFLLAATGHPDKALAEMAAVAKQFPAFPFMARAELRVGLVLRVRRNDLADAARFARMATEDLPLSLRDETLVDLVRAVAHPESAGAGEVERLRRELRTDAELAQWLRTVAPSVVHAFETKPAQLPEIAHDEHDEEAEREALAEAEVEQEDGKTGRIGY
jgi:hypothetical protein